MTSSNGEFSCQINLPLPTILTVEDRVAPLTLNRDDVRNKLTGINLVEDIEKAVEWINSDDRISALIVTGAGKNFSSAGLPVCLYSAAGTFF